MIRHFQRSVRGRSLAPVEEGGVVCRSGRARCSHGGMTLIEMLIGMTITLIMMFAIVQIFQVLGDNIRTSRSIIEMSGQMRAVAHRLQADLDGVTVPVRPAAENDTPSGYFMYVEGPQNDWADESGTAWTQGDQNRQSSQNGQANSALGDMDDILAFTALSKGEPFVGSIGGPMRESQLAEIVWWTIWNDINGNGFRDLGEVKLYRWVLLIRPDLSSAISSNLDDISVGLNGPNTLADLTRHENRVTLQRIQTTLGSSPAALAERLILSDVLAFDVRAFDPLAPLTTDSTGTVALTPGDPEYTATTSSSQGLGAFVDLNYAGNTGSFFSGQGDGRPNLLNDGSLFSLGYPTYDTWSFHYETDPAYGTAGNGVNGLDDGNGIVGIVDDPGERISRAPYPVPLRGIQVTIRMMEYSTRQVRQTSVVSNFVPD